MGIIRLALTVVSCIVHIYSPQLLREVVVFDSPSATLIFCALNHHDDCCMDPDNYIGHSTSLHLAWCAHHARRRVTSHLDTAIKCDVALPSLHLPTVTNVRIPTGRRNL